MRIPVFWAPLILEDEGTTLLRNVGTHPTTKRHVSQERNPGYSMLKNSITRYFGLYVSNVTRYKEIYSY
jgi:hypothetical protein